MIKPYIHFHSSLCKRYELSESASDERGRVIDEFLLHGKGITVDPLQGHGPFLKYLIPDGYCIKRYPVFRTIFSFYDAHIAVEAIKCRSHRHPSAGNGFLPVGEGNPLFTAAAQNSGLLASGLYSEFSYNEIGKMC